MSDSPDANQTNRGLVVGSPGSEQFWRLFRCAMRQLGYIEDQSIRYEFRSDRGQVNRLPELAAELVRLNVDLIVTWFTPAAQAAKGATREIPIVMALAGNPVETGLVASLDRPGRQHHRHGRRGRGTRRQERGADSRDVAVGASRSGAGQCARSSLEAVSRTDPARRHSHRNDDRCENDSRLRRA
jgi:ABC transporter substrate binding protein